ncbi:19062_t:CDS:2 [Entrophospora sp. SA101]|nr:19062_t:CDS:2 [Entrophospora sp. SA101]
MAETSSKIPVTVFTGFLGSGKTTIIISLLKRVPKSYKICLLKNEFGDMKVDSELVRESNIEVQEMLNGCLCCVLVGQMKTALLELKEKYNPDRIIIETSGSAFPAPIALQIREMNNNGFILDSIVTVIDCENFSGYEDTSYTAKMQAQYTDVILLNKHELVDERKLDIVIDHVNDLNTDTPKIKCEGKTGVSIDLIFGLDTKLFNSITSSNDNNKKEKNSKDDNTILNYRELIDENHHENEIDLIQIFISHEIRGKGEVIEGDYDNNDNNIFTKKYFINFLKSLSKDDVYRLKGFVRLIKDDGEDNEATLYYKSCLW